jgi:cation-transporting P-type ATPase 13A2
LFLVSLVTDQSWYSTYRETFADRRYIPPIVDPDDPEIRNSDNTVLFLMSCYQYIMIAIILSVGPPFRQPMVQNGTPPIPPIAFPVRPGAPTVLMTVPFMVTITVAVIFTTMVILSPPSWLASVLQLTPMTISFSFLLIAIAMGNFVSSWISEKFIFVRIRELLDRFSAWRRKGKRGARGGKFKRYQVVEEAM